MEKGIDRFYLPNIDSSTTEDMLSLESKYPGICFPMIGLHPCSVKADYLEEINHVVEQLETRSYCAIGEIGMDLYWDKTFVDQQRDAFVRQIQLANSHEIPIVIHSRETLDMNIEIVSTEKSKTLRGIFHCFTGSENQARQILELGFLLGIGGVLTYKNSDLKEVLKNIPLEGIVLETDSPYLTPVPFRGKRNESAYVYYVAEKLAEVKGVSLDEVAEITTRNAKELFGE
jgi:TatD DNase family protein